ncbi:MAG: WG repeat-containing protein [Litorilinea sp.]
MRRMIVPWARVALLLSVALATPVLAAHVFHARVPTLFSSVAYAAPARQTAALTPDALANAEYFLDAATQDGDIEDPAQAAGIQLEAGVYRDATRTIRVLPALTTYGDFTGNGLDEAIAVLESVLQESLETENADPATAPGDASPATYHLAIVMEQEGAPLNLVTLDLGQDIILESLDMVGSEIVVNRIDRVTATPLTQIFVLDADQVLQYEIPGLTPTLLASATYTGIAVSEEAITLIDGEFTGEFSDTEPDAEQDAASALTVQLTGDRAFGDLNGDLVPDAAVILASSGGGTGTFVDLAAVLNDEGAPVNVATTALGDRVRMEDIFIDNGVIVLDVVTHGPEDPMCCPSQTARLAFTLADDTLVAVDVEQPVRTVSAAYGPLFATAEFQNGQEQYGYVNLAGDFIIAPQFASALPFVEGLAAVEDPTGTFGYIDATGEYVIAPQFTFAGDFQQGIAVVGLAEGGGQAYINRQGDVLFDGATFAAAQPFSEGMAAVRPESNEAESNAGENNEEASGGYGYINRQGELIIEPRFATAQHFSGGLALISIDGQYGFVNRSGRLSIAAQFPRSGTFAEGLAPIELFGQFGYISMVGDLVIRSQFEMASSFREGFALVTLEGQQLYIDPAGIALNTDVTISRGSPFHEGLAAVTVDGLVGYLDSAGQLAIEPQFLGGGDFENGMAVVRTESTWGVINPEGTWLLQLPVR